MHLLRWRSLWYTLGGLPLILCTLACNYDRVSEAKHTMSADPSPEAVYRRLFLALLDPESNSIRDLILDHEGAEILWTEGRYPDTVAEALRKQYQEMSVEKVVGESQGNDHDRIFLKSSALPFPLAVVKREGKWKVDAGPIIEMRKQAAQIRSKSH